MDRIVTYAQVALDGPLHVGFRQASSNHSTLRRFSVGDGMHIRGGAPHIHDDERSEPGALPAALREQTRAFHDRDGCGHQHFVKPFRGGVDAFCMDDTLDEHLPYHLPGRLDVERTELRHDIFRHDDGLAGPGKAPRNLVGHRTIACDDHRAVER